MSKPVYCDFCGISSKQPSVDVMIAGPQVHICGACVLVALDVVIAQRTDALAKLRDVQTCVLRDLKSAEPPA